MAERRKSSKIFKQLQASVTASAKARLVSGRESESKNLLLLRNSKLTQFFAKDQQVVSSHSGGPGGTPARGANPLKIKVKFPLAA